MRKKWNGEHYVCYGPEKYRSWAVAAKYGFISAGGGSVFIKPLRSLEPGSRIWVYAPGKGYVGVGIIEEPMVMADNFLVKGPTGEKLPITRLRPIPKSSFITSKHLRDPERGERLVRVGWLKKVTLEKAVREKGFFWNENVVCRPTNAKWDYTVRRLKERFHIGNTPPLDEDPASKSTGALFGELENNKEVERAAVEHVECWYKQRQWNVKSVENEKKGYDLFCTKTLREECVEVKGVKGAIAKFIITAGEYREARENSNFVLCVVTSALSRTRRLERYSGPELQKHFKFREIAFRASPLMN